MGQRVSTGQMCWLKGVFPDLSPALRSCTISPRVGPEGARTSPHTPLPPLLRRPEPALRFQSGPCDSSCPWAPPLPPAHLPLEPGLLAGCTRCFAPGLRLGRSPRCSAGPAGLPVLSLRPRRPGRCSSEPAAPTLLLLPAVTPTAQPETEPPSPKACVDGGVGHIPRPLPR